MSFEMIVGLDIKDTEIYRDYRTAMKPLLEKYGGGFRYDFLIQETLKSEVKEPINRVFAIYFKDEANKESFFANPEYLEIKKKYFESSVRATTIISSYERKDK